MEDKNDKKSKKSWYIWTTPIAIVILVVFIFWFLTKRDIKTTGKYPDDVSSQSIECIKKNVAYKFFANDEPTNSEVKITAIFDNNKIDSISLVHQTVYDTKETAKIMSDGHQGDMNNSFYNSGMEAYALNATYVINDKTAQMTLYAIASSLNDVSIKYFLLNSMPGDLTGYRKSYTAQGFDCEVKQ